jgi:translation initiation factor IF-3
VWYTLCGVSGIVFVFHFLVSQQVPFVAKKEVWPINRDFRGNDRPRETRVNERVRAREVRLIDENGESIGVMSSQRALDIARDRNLDLVEVSPNANPPVCRLMDYGRFKYEQAKKENEARKNQKTITLKDIRLSPRTDEHDIDVKTRKILEFLAEGDRVRVSIKFRGAEMRHPDIGRKLLDGIAEVLKGIGVVERSPVMEGKMMSMIVSRAPGWEPPKKQAPAPAAGKKHQAQHADAEAASPTATQAEPEPVLVPEDRESPKPSSEEG